MSEEEILKLSGEELADWLEGLAEAEEYQQLQQVLVAFLPAIIFCLRKVDLEEELKLLKN
jgi:hypothetical protein